MLMTLAVILAIVTVVTFAKPTAAEVQPPSLVADTNEGFGM